MTLFTELASLSRKSAQLSSGNVTMAQVECCASTQQQCKHVSSCSCPDHLLLAVTLLLLVGPARHALVSLIAVLLVPAHFVCPCLSCSWIVALPHRGESSLIRAWNWTCILELGWRGQTL